MVKIEFLKNQKTLINKGFFRMGAIVEEVRTVFEKKNDASVYIPNLNVVLSVI